MVMVTIVSSEDEAKQPVPVVQPVTVWVVAVAKGGGNGIEAQVFDHYPRTSEVMALGGAGWPIIMERRINDTVEFPDTTGIEKVIATDRDKGYQPPAARKRGRGWEKGRERIGQQK